VEIVERQGCYDKIGQGKKYQTKNQGRSPPKLKLGHFLEKGQKQKGKKWVVWKKQGAGYIGRGLFTLLIKRN